MQTLPRPPLAVLRDVDGVIVNPSPEHAASRVRAQEHVARHGCAAGDVKFPHLDRQVFVQHVGAT